MKEIRGDAKNLSALLGNSKFAIDYYQREYRWQKKQVGELIDDLTEKFLDSYEEGHDQGDVADYGHYFLGSIIVSARDGRKFIIDGQQRLTTLTLLLIHIYRNLDDEHQKAELTRLICSYKHGQHSFNLDVPERGRCMEAILEGKPFDESDQPESVANIVRRYHDVQELFRRRHSHQSNAPFRGLAYRERPSCRDHGLLGRRRLHDLRDHERPGAIAHSHRNAEGISPREYHRVRPPRCRQPLLAGPSDTTAGHREGRGRGCHQDVAP